MAKGKDIQNLKHFLSLVRMGMWGRAEDLQPEGTDWEKITRWARQQTVIPIVAEGMEVSGLAEQIKENCIADLFESSASNARIHHLLDNAAAKAYTLLEEEDIPSVLIKGQGIARSYRNPLLRQCGDVDLLVGSRNYEKIPQTLSKHGYTIARQGGKHTDFYVSDFRVEIHRVCVETSSSVMNSFFLSWGDRQVKDSSKSFSPAGSEVMVRIPEDEFNAIYVFVHMFSALVSNGTGLRQLCDLAAVLSSGGKTLNREIILKSLTSHKLLRAWQVFGCVLVDYLGLPVEDFPFYDETQLPKAERLMDLIIESGNFGFFLKRPQGRQSVWSTAGYLWRKFVWKTSMVKLFPESLTKI